MRKICLFIIGIVAAVSAIQPYTYFWTIKLTGDTATVTKWKANNDSTLAFATRASDTMNKVIPRWNWFSNHDSTFKWMNVDTIKGPVNIDSLLGINKVSGNPVMDSISGTDNIAGNPKCDSLKEVDKISGNPVIDSIMGLDNIAGNPKCDSLKEMDNISGNPKIDSIQGMNKIAGNPVIDSIQGVNNLSGNGTINIDSIKTRALNCSGTFTVGSTVSVDSLFVTKGERSAHLNTGDFVTTGRICGNENLAGGIQIKRVALDSNTDASFETIFTTKTSNFPYGYLRVFCYNSPVVGEWVLGSTSVVQIYDKFSNMAVVDSIGGIACKSDGDGTYSIKQDIATSLTFLLIFFGSFGAD
jgi:hypothetical protein